MAINIFKVDADSADASGDKRASDIVGRFRSGYQVGEGKDARPVALSEWRITTADPEVAKAVVGLMGAEEEPSKWETSTGEDIQVFTTTSKVDVVVEGTNAIKATLVLWGNAGKILETDGTYLYDEEGNLTDEHCSMTYGKTLAELKDLARKGKGPGPSLQVYFHLADAPELGKFKFFSGSWTAMEEFADRGDAQNELTGPQAYTLELEKVEFTTKEGEDVRFYKPRLTYVGPASAHADVEPF